MNVFEMVMNYFKNEEHGVSKYEPVGVVPVEKGKDNYLYKVIAQYTGDNEWKKGTYAVWTSFNTSVDNGSMNYGHYDMTFESAMEVFKGIEKKPISWDRLSELATKFKDGLEQDDKEEALKYFTEECDMTDEELDYFGIEKPKKYKTVRVEVNFEFEMLLPEDVDERDYAYYNLDLEQVISDGVSTNIYTDVRREDISREEAERIKDEYYGYIDYEE